MQKITLLFQKDNRMSAKFSYSCHVFMLSEIRTQYVSGFFCILRVTFLCFACDFSEL